MANTIEKIFKMLLESGDGEGLIVKTGKFLRSLNSYLRDLLKTTQEISKTQKEIKVIREAAGAEETVREKTAQAESIEKKIRLNDQATTKALETAAKEHQDKLDKLNKEQKAHEAGSMRYKDIEAEKLSLLFDYEQKQENIREAGADARTKILQKATENELKEYAKIPDKAAEAEKQITDNKRKAVAEKLQLAQKETETTVTGSKGQYDASEAAADVAFGKKGRKRKVAGLANEVQLHKNYSQAYLKELNAIIAGGDEAIAQHKDRYNELIELLGKEQLAALNLSRGKNADGSGRGFWQRFLELPEKDLEQLKQQAWNLATQLSDAIFSVKQKASQKQLANDKKRIDAEYKTQVKALNSKRDKGLISEKQYQKELEKLDAKKAEKAEAAERAAFERQKKLNIQQAIMNTAISVAKTFAQWGWPLGIPFAALAFAQGMIQVATIQSQKFARGGIISLGEGMGVVKGRSHAQGGHRIYLDGMPIGEVEGDELLAIVNKRDTARIGALSAANSVHGRRFAHGGLLSSGGFLVSHVAAPVSIGQIEARQRTELARKQAEIQLKQDAVIQALAGNIEAINDRIDTLKVVVLAQDMTDTQNNIKRIKVKSSW